MKTIPRIILLADGRSERWNSPVPKHLIVLRGEVLLHRTVRQLLSRGAADVWITTHREDYRVPGTRSYAPEENKFQIDQFHVYPVDNHK